MYNEMSNIKRDLILLFLSLISRLISDVTILELFVSIIKLSEKIEKYFNMKMD